MRYQPNRLWSWFVCLLVGVTASSRPAGAVEPAAFQVRVIHNFTPFSAVGRKKAGLLCAPNGKMTWGDIAPSDPQTISAMMLSALRREEGTTARWQIRNSITVLVVELNLSACAKHWGLGDRATYKGNGQISVEWQVEGGPANRKVAKTISAFKLDGTTPPLEAAFGAAAHDYVMTVASGQ